MKAFELRLGNLVYIVDEEMDPPKEVVEVSINWLKAPEILEPIPLSEEWLLKFGFSEIRDHLGKSWKFEKEKWTTYVWRSERFGIATYDEDGDVDGVTYFAWETKYVHQLQNLYFALTGEELTNKRN